MTMEFKLLNKECCHNHIKRIYDFLSHFSGKTEVILQTTSCYQIVKCIK